jgi:hypothetical protein
MQHTEEHASWLFIAVCQYSANFGKETDLYIGVLMAIPPTDIQILFTNYDIYNIFFKPGFLFRTFY